MVIIEKDGGAKAVFFDFTPNTDGEAYLFELLSKETGEETLFCQVNIGPDEGYFQEFIFEEGGVDPLDGGFILDAGEYDYTIYEVPSLTIDKNLATAVVGKGLMKIITKGNDQYNAADNDSFIIYE